MHNSSYQNWFTELDGLLTEHRGWWQLQPFHHRQCCWAASAPELAAALAALSDERVAALDADSEQLASWLSEWIPDAERLLQLSRLPRLPNRPIAPPARMAEGIPGRKWQQLLAFVAAIPTGKSPVLEWCAGKGHLGRLVSAVQRRSVKSLEWQAGLCAQGEQQAQHWQLPQRFICADAFASEAAEQIAAGDQVLALHACGDLHTSLMRHWSRKLDGHCRLDSEHQEPSRLSLSPCCYHLIRSEGYEPLSLAAQASELRLSKADLQLPLQQTVTAGAHVRRLGDQEAHWRLAFDELQRDWRGLDEYLPLPNLRKRLLAGDFSEFVRWAFEQKQLLELANFKAPLDADHWLALGQQRLKAVRRMELVTHLFRRPLEIWLALDRALYLEQQGARVSLGEFCEPALTPRNILLQAER